MGNLIYAFQKNIGDINLEHDHSIISWKLDERFLVLLKEVGTVLTDEILSEQQGHISFNQQQLGSLVSICKDIYHGKEETYEDDTEKEHWRYILKTLGLLESKINWTKEHMLISLF